MTPPSNHQQPWRATNRLVLWRFIRPCGVASRALAPLVFFPGPWSVNTQVNWGKYVASYIYIYTTYIYILLIYIYTTYIYIYYLYIYILLIYIYYLYIYTTYIYILTTYIYTTYIYIYYLYIYYLYIYIYTLLIYILIYIYTTYIYILLIYIYIYLYTTYIYIYTTTIYIYILLIWIYFLIISQKQPIIQNTRGDCSCWPIERKKKLISWGMAMAQMIKALMTGWKISATGIIGK